MDEEVMITYAHNWEGRIVSECVGKNKTNKTDIHHVIAPPQPPLPIPPHVPLLSSRLSLEPFHGLAVALPLGPGLLEQLGPPLQDPLLVVDGRLEPVEPRALPLDGVPQLALGPAGRDVGAAEATAAAVGQGGLGAKGHRETAALCAGIRCVTAGTGTGIGFGIGSAAAALAPAVLL